MQKTYDEIRATYSCALPTEQELRDFFANLNMHLAIEDHVGPAGTSKNLVCYFTPFRGKFLNYVRCFNSFHRSLHGEALGRDPKPHYGKRFPIYIILVGDRLNRSIDIPYIWRTFERPDGESGTNWERISGTSIDFRIRRYNRNITDAIYPTVHKDLQPSSGGRFSSPRTLRQLWSYYILLSETDARRGFSILKFDVMDTGSDRRLLNREASIPKSWKLPYLYALMECKPHGRDQDKIFAKSSNVLNIDDSTNSFSLSERED